MQAQLFHIPNYINGQLIPPAAAGYLPNENPATGQHYSLVPDSDAADVNLAVQAAKAAFPAWAATKAADRGALLEKIASLIEERLEELALAEANDTGKPLSLARSVDIPRAVSNFRFFATAILHTATETHHTDDLALNYTLRQPLGVVGCISPWNLPLYLLTWKIAPALAAGNCVVAKPSEVTPMTAYLLAEICREAGLPPGVLNIVHGLGSRAGAEIVAHRDVKAISFTGGTQTGRAIAAVAAPMLKKLSLELGGKNPNIIFADCDFDKALNTTVRSSFANQGQICLCGSRIFIEASIYEKFKNAFVEKVAQMKVGDPLDPATQLGAVVSKAHFDKIQYYIKLAQEEGGRLLHGGQALNVEGRCEGGYFIAPSIIEGVGADCRTAREEIFGPVVTLHPFSSEEEVIAYANGTEYGLSATIWTEHLSRAHRLAARVESGVIWVNCWLLRDLRTPFGGMKNSGVGREGGLEALHFFTEPKNVCIALS